MSKTVTDEMVERAFRARFGTFFPFTTYEKENERRILEAALNPPAEPEVCEQCSPAPGKAVMAYAKDHVWRCAACERPLGERSTVEAMYSARPKKDVGEPPYGGQQDRHYHRRSTDFSYGTSRLTHSHRRKDDTWDGLGPGGA